DRHGGIPPLAEEAPRDLQDGLPRPRRVADAAHGADPVEVRAGASAAREDEGPVSTLPRSTVPTPRAPAGTGPDARGIPVRRSTSSVVLVESTDRARERARPLAWSTTVST